MICSLMTINRSCRGMDSACSPTRKRSKRKRKIKIFIQRLCIAYDRCTLVPPLMDVVVVIVAVIVVVAFTVIPKRLNIFWKPNRGTAPMQPLGRPTMSTSTSRSLPWSLLCWSITKEPSSRALALGPSKVDRRAKFRSGSDVGSILIFQKTFFFT